MILRRKDSDLEALQRLNPRNRTHFDSLVEEHALLREEILNDEGSPPAEAPDFAASRRMWTSRPHRRVIGLSAAGVVVAAAVIAVAITLLSGAGSPLAPDAAYAAEAVKKAAVDTSAAAQSGVIQTSIVIDGQEQVNSVFSWNGDDLSLMAGDPTRELRYVDGRYYESYGYSVPIETGDAEHEGQWVHCTDYDNGGPADPGDSAVELPNPSQWLSAARSDLAGSGLIDVVSKARGYERRNNPDGSVTYTGTTTVAAVRSLDLGTNGLPVASQPSFKVNDPQTPVTIAVTVNSDGLIQKLALEWTLDQPGENSHWSYIASYSDLGTAAAIVAPDAEHTVTTDNRFPRGSEAPAGEI